MPINSTKDSEQKATLNAVLYVSGIYFINFQNIIEMKIKNVKMIEVDEFNKLVSTTYGKTYNFQQQDDCKGRGIEYITVPCEEEDYENESIPEKVNGKQMGVSFKAWLERDVNKPVGKETEKWEIDLFWERNFYPHVSMIINDLHKKGLLKAGKYAIEIDW